MNSRTFNARCTISYSLVSLDNTELCSFLCGSHQKIDEYRILNVFRHKNFR